MLAQAALDRELLGLPDIRKKMMEIIQVSAL
jgi:hypothetical protein